MRYLLDSNTASDFYNRDSPDHARIRDHIALLADEDRVLVSILTLYEMEFGYANAPEMLKPSIRVHIESLKADFELAPLPPQGAEAYGVLKQRLRDRRGLKPRQLRKRNVDLMLAATAISIDAVLVSGDGLFGDSLELIPGLAVESWLETAGSNSGTADQRSETGDHANPSQWVRKLRRLR